MLAEAGYDFEVRPPSRADDCRLRNGETASEMVCRLAIEKANDVAGQIAEGLVLACDTVAECGAQILGKPESEADARRMLQLLSGREHRVLSGVCLLRVPQGQPLTRVAVTTLRMDRLSQQQLEEYIAGGQWEGKAGAFGYQDRLGWIHVVAGSESNVVGLPLELLAEMLAGVNC